MKIPIRKWNFVYRGKDYSEWLFFEYTLKEWRYFYWWLFPSKIWHRFLLKMGYIRKEELEQKFFVTEKIEAGEWVIIKGMYAEKYRNEKEE